MGANDPDMRSLQAWRAQAMPTPTPERFSGPVFIHALNDTSERSEIEVLAVFFEAGSRTLPHTHDTDQLLYFLEGEGVVATQGERRLFRAGGMAYIPAGRWHWHGATPTRAASHLSIRPGGPSAWPPDVPLLDWESFADDVGIDA
jgi:quercetin dioxygenase-like cupin family protein